MEWEGDQFIGLAAKTYFCGNKNAPNKNKYSAKGIMKSAGLTQQDFSTVLNTKTSVPKLNRGFIMRGQAMLTYCMERTGLSYLYAKRKVLNDGISTTYLDL